jgi:hypothetical protein
MAEWLLVVILGISLTNMAQASEISALSSHPDAGPLNLREEPSPRDWQHFFSMTDSERKKLWIVQKNQGHTYVDWAWQWRIGWIRACARSQKTYCGRIMAQGLQDPAMVVRAEAATRIGDRFEGTASDYPLSVTLLARAYKHPANSRHGKPMFVHFRILDALNRIGGSKALAHGDELAQDYPQTAAYWQKVTQF